MPIAAAVTEALARIERNGDLKFRAPDPEGGPNAYFNLSVPKIAISYTIVDNGAAFVVNKVRPYFVG